MRMKLLKIYTVVISFMVCYLLCKPVPETPAPDIQFDGRCFTDEWCNAYTKIDELQRKYQDLYDLCTERRIALRCHYWVVERMEK